MKSRAMQFTCCSSESQNCAQCSQTPVFFLDTGQPSSASESPIEDLYKTRVPSTGLSLNSFHAVRYCSGAVPPHDAAARTNQNISIYLPSAVSGVANLLPQHCNSVLCQTCPATPNCLVSVLGSVSQTGCSPARELHLVVNALVSKLVVCTPGAVLVSKSLYLLDDKCYS